jgi:hypothetical protein
MGFLNFQTPKVRYRVHKSSLLATILSQIKPVYIATTYLSKIRFNIIHTPPFWSSY